MNRPGRLTACTHTRMLVSVCLLACSLSITVEGVVVNTRYGSVRGVRETVGDNIHVDRYTGIPYAQPPTGYLRFHAPLAVSAWSGTLDATGSPPKCPQPPSPHRVYNNYPPNDEDCLYLNIFSPVLPHGHLPVMVWIHGGAYYLGTGMAFDPWPLAAKGVVVVSFNYRLGALGFLSTEDVSSPGNYGLLDQIQALKFVRDVISDFNGDPNDVTIFGQSAGGSSVSFLVASSLATGLFQKAITESGDSMMPTIYLPPRLDPHPRAIAARLGDMLGCGGHDSLYLVACLRTKSVDSILNASVQIYGATQNKWEFVPVSEGSFGQPGVLSTVPEDYWRGGHFNTNVTVIRGFNKDDAAYFLSRIDPDNNGLTALELQGYMNNFLDLYLKQPALNGDTARIRALLMEGYFANETDPIRLRELVVQMMTDFIFLSSTLKETMLASQVSPMPQYLYRFSHRSANKLNPSWHGVEHTDEVQYVFGSPIANVTQWKYFVSSWTDDDRSVSDDVMTMWSNFAKYGNPTPSGFNDTQWLPWDQNTPRLLDIGVHTQMMDFPVTSNIRLWTDVIPQLMQGSAAPVG